MTNLPAHYASQHRLISGQIILSPQPFAFRKQYPAVKIELSLSDTQFNPVDAQFDIAFRVGWLKDSANIARKISSFQQVIVAAPEVVENFGLPHDPEDLQAYPFH